MLNKLKYSPRRKSSSGRWCNLGSGCASLPQPMNTTQVQKLPQTVWRVEMVEGCPAQHQQLRGVCSLPQSCCDTGTAASPAMLLSEGSLHFATRSFSFFCHPNRLTRVLICSQLPERRFCKKLSPVPAGGADPIPAPPWSQGCNLSLGHKTSGHKGISFCQSV